MTHDSEKPAAPKRFRRQGDESIEVDHKFLRTVLSWLRSSSDEGAIAALLEDLDEYLTGHFAAEERDNGFFASVLRTAPRQARRVEELKAEHGTIKETVSKLRDELAPPYGTASGELIAKVEALATTLQRHERKENAVLQDSLESDIPAGD